MASYTQPFDGTDLEATLEPWEGWGYVYSGILDPEPGRLHMREDNWTLLENVTVSLKVLAPTRTGTVSLVLKWIDAGNHLLMRVNFTTSKLQLCSRRFYDPATVISEASLTTIPAGFFWIQAILDRNDFTGKTWTTDPSLGGTALQTIAEGLGASDRAAFGAKVDGSVGIDADVPDATWRFDDLKVTDSAFVPNEVPYGTLSYAVPSPYRTHTTFPPAGWQPTRSDSVFRTAIPANVPDHPKNTVVMDNFLEQINEFPGNAGTIDAGEASWAIPTYFAADADPYYTLDCLETYSFDLQGYTQIRCPVEAKPSENEGDRHLTVIQPNGVTAHLYNCFKDDDTNTLTFDSGTLNSQVYGDVNTPDGSIAAHLFSSVGQIRACELEAGEINHTLQFVYGAGGYGHRYPCTGQARTVDGVHGGGSPWWSDTNTNNKIILGYRFQLMMTEGEINASSEPDWVKAIWQALATYGMIATDTGGIGLRFEPDGQYGTFGYDPPGQEFCLTQMGLGDLRITEYEGLFTMNWGAALDWSKFRLVEEYEGLKVP